MGFAPPQQYNPEVVMLLSQGPTALYTEQEAADALGVSVEQLRSLVAAHILSGESSPAPIEPGIAQYSRSDLILLRFLRSQPAPAA